MCGRYSLTAPPEAIMEAFGVVSVPALQPRWNIAPTQAVPVVRLDAAGARECVIMRWGLIPSWARDAAIGHKLINARAETLAEKPAFRNALRRRRCLVPADGFYEWKQEGARKQPCRIALADGGLFAFAGLWEQWSDPLGKRVETFTIVTTGANERVAPIHDRMPVILDAAGRAAWLDPAGREPGAALRPFPAEALRAWPVGTRVNSPANEGPECAVLLEMGG